MKTLYLLNNGGTEMIPSVIHSYIASSKNQKEKLTYQPIPIFETVEEARQSLIKEKGNYEYSIKESYVAVNLFRVCWVQDNEVYTYEYEKKITGWRN